ncbi:hypothetical protein ACFV46_31130 [Streptomyces sp. NPDC059852]
MPGRTGKAPAQQIRRARPAAAPATARHWALPRQMHNVPEE